MSNALTVIARKVGAVALPDNDRYTNRLQIKSASSSRLYIVAQNKKTRQFECSCMGWIRHRHCKHLDTITPVFRLSQR